MSDTDEPDFDLTKLARRLSISSDDWNSDTSSKKYNWAQGDTRPVSRQSATSPSAASSAESRFQNSQIHTNEQRLSRHPLAEPSLAIGNGNLATDSPVSRDLGNPSSTSRTSPTTSRPPAMQDNLAGLGLSDASWSQALTRAKGLARDAGTDKLLPSSPLVPLDSGSHVTSLVDPRGSASGSTLHIKPKITSRKTVGAASGQDSLNHSTGSSSGSPPQYALHMPLADTENPASLLKEKRRSLRSSIAGEDDADALNIGAGATSRRSSITKSPNLNNSQTSCTSSSPRLPTISRTPSASHRPGLSRGSSGSFTRDRSGSIGRKVGGQHSRSSSRASMHLPGSAPVVSRRISGHRSASTYVKGKALSLEAAELLEVLKEEHHRMLDDSSSSESLRRTQPLVIDTRCLPDYLGPAGRIKGSINCNFPSLLIKRFKRGKVANFMLENFITTDTGKRLFQHVARSVLSPHTSPDAASQSSQSPSSSKALADLDVFVVDENISQLDGSSTGSILVSVLEQVTGGQVGRGSLCYLHGSYTELASLPAASDWIVYGEEGDLATLRHQSGDEDTDTPASGKQLHIRSPPRVSSATALQTAPKSASHSPDQRPERKSSRTHLSRLDTGENTQGFSNKSHRFGLRSASPSSWQDSESAASSSRPDSRGSNLSLQELCRQQANSPHHTAFDSSITSRRNPSAHAARAGEVSEARASSPTPPGTAGDAPEFLISTVIPGFIFLGPEPQTKEDIAQLKELGVQQVLNMALEIDEGALVGQFEKYVKIPMRDFVDETGVQDRIDEACGLLDDADLKSKSVYVHCRAGKSRSVTIVLAYLIHRYHWTLNRAYEHVSEKRKGISPNIGFMSELMRFEERELGTKSSGANMSSPSSMPGPSAKPQAQRAASSVRPTMGTLSAGSSANGAESARGTSNWSRMRDSMPPIHSSPSALGQFSSDREQEVKGYNGAWVHARRDQMDERFQPNRRASKAGLESNCE